MVTDEQPLAPVNSIDGYLPLEDYGLIGDGAAAALVGRDGSIPWLCVPRFDSPPLFCALLDAAGGGSFTVAPERVVAARQRYEPDSGVLVTELRGDPGLVRVTDALTLRSGADLTEDLAAERSELLRRVEVLDGPVRVRVDLSPRGGADARGRGSGLRIICTSAPGLDLQLFSSVALEGLRSIHSLETGDRLDLVLAWGSRSRRRQSSPPDDSLASTQEAWRRWMRRFRYEGPREPLVRRSALTLKMLDHSRNGAIVAAPTSSLPEAIGGPRNWDYRFSWIRDAAFSVYALRRVGLEQEAWSFLEWVLDAVEGDERPKVLYDLDGFEPSAERVDPALEGYRRSPPVRWGNAAARQRQHDVFGEILDCAYQWAARGGEIDGHLWGFLCTLVEAAGRRWREPDSGIWEVRTAGRPFTYSAALCHVALDRGAKLARRLGLPGDVAGWSAEAHHIAETILHESWDPELQALTEHLGIGGLDASLLSLPLRRVIPATHPRMEATVRAVVDRLGAGDGLLYRYLPEESPDGLPGHEGAFLLCSFWLVDNLAKQGRMDEAMELFDSLCARANALGLLPEQVDPSTGGFLGNYPQAFSHVGVISSGVNLARCLDRSGDDR